MTNRVSVPTFLGGISQQAHAQRQSSLVDDALNIEFQPTQGATKRYPTEHIATIAADLTGSRIVTLERDDGDYLVVLSSSGVRVFSTDGTEQTVNAPGGFSYLAGVGPKQLRWQQVADSLFVASTLQTVAGTAGPVGASWRQPGEANLFVRAGNYGVKYTVTIKLASMPSAEVIDYTVPSTPVDQAAVSYGSGFDDTVTANQAAGIDPIVIPHAFDSTEYLFYRVNGGAARPGSDFRGDPRTREVFYEGSALSAGHTLETGCRAHTIAYFIQTNDILDVLKGRIDARVAGLTFEGTDNGSSVRIHAAEAIDEFSVNDSQADSFIVGWQEQVELISDLPLVGKHGQHVRIAGGTGDTADDYWVVFASTEWAEDTDRDFDQFASFSGYGPGTWLEASEPDLPTGGIDASTMPHILKRLDASTFSWAPVDWAARGAGDTESNEVPSFVGEQLRDIFWTQNRLGFLSQTEAVLSESGEPYNFWRTTVLSLPDSDPIDVTVADLEGDVLNHAVPFDDRLVLLSRTGQAVLFGDPVLTPSTVQAPVLSSYRCFTDVPAVLDGRSLFFGYSSGQFAQIREYIPSEQERGFVDALVTTGVPKLIPSSVRRLERASVDQQLAVLTEDDPNEMFVYQYLRQSGELLQASWSRWRFSGPIVDIAYLDDEMMLLVVRDGSTYLERIKLGLGRTENVGDPVVRLDRRAQTTLGTYDRATDLTTFVAPYSFEAEAPMRLVTFESPELPYGSEIVPIETTGATGVLKVAGNLGGQRLLVGETYESSLTLSRPYYKQEARRGSYSILGASQTVRQLIVQLTNTGYLRAEVSYVASDPASQEFGVNRLDVANLEALEAIREGEMNIGIHANVEEFTVKLINDSAAPSTITSGAWDIRLKTPHRAS